MNPSTSSAADTPANHSASPESGGENPTPVTFGPISIEPFATYDPDTHSWKTFAVISLWDSIESSVTWPKSGMTQNGLAYRRQQSVHLTSAGDSSLSLPTPSATSYGSNQSPSSGAAVRPSLETMARRGMWPTPQGSDPDGSRTLPPETTITGRTPDGKKRQVGLPWMVQQVERGMWPTPTMADVTGGPGNSGRDGGENLRTAVGGQLNPTWVEWLMGFPTGWTDLEPSATPSSPKSPNGSDTKS